jgi:excisionase family DNA binding protein
MSFKADFISATISTSPKLLTIRDAAQVLNVNVRTIHTLLKKQQLSHYKVRGQWRFDRVHLNEYLAKRICQGRGVS